MIVNLIQSPPPIEVIVGLVQMPGLLLWGFGILQYLRSVNSALELIESGKLWIILLMLTALATSCLIVINALYNPWIGFVENIVLSPLVIGLVMFTIIALGLVLIFRQGEFAKSLFLIFIGFFLYFIRTAQWTLATSVLGTPANSFFALEACVFFGAAFVLARNLSNPKKRV
jgi:FlaA1/EpsC-like NDP-sugar epimerase